LIVESRNVDNPLIWPIVEVIKGHAVPVVTAAFNDGYNHEAYVIHFQYTG